MRKTIIKYSIILLSAVVFLPAAVQLLHIFNDHEHTVCVSKNDAHFHQKDLDCVLCHLQGETYWVSNEIDFVALKNELLVFNNKPYNFLSNYQQLSFSLRGPPVFI
ncbi:MAG: hypothetical protein JXQ93_09300 [Flavobacteriaceae bacterium]